MSNHATGQVYKLNIPSSLKFVLVSMADHADHDGFNIFPGIKMLMRKTGYCERAVQGIIKKLIAGRYLEVQQERPGRKTIYRIPQWVMDGLAEPPQDLHPRKDCAPAKSAVPHSRARTPAKSAPPPPQNGAIPPHPPIRKEPSVEPSDNHPLGGSSTAPRESAEDRFQRFCAEYPRRGRYDVKIAKARKEHLSKFKNAKLAEEIIDGARRFRLFSEANGEAGTHKIPTMPVWLDDDGWKNPYLILVSEAEEVERPREPKVGLDFIWHCPDGGPAIKYEKDKSGPFDALRWFEERSLPVHRNWVTYCEQQREAS